VNPASARRARIRRTSTPVLNRPQLAKSVSWPGACDYFLSQPIFLAPPFCRDVFTRRRAESICVPLESGFLDGFCISRPRHGRLRFVLRHQGGTCSLGESTTPGEQATLGGCRAPRCVRRACRKMGRLHDLHDGSCTPGRLQRQRQLGYSCRFPAKAQSSKEG